MRKKIFLESKKKLKSKEDKKLLKITISQIIAGSLSIIFASLIVTHLINKEETINPAPFESFATFEDSMLGQPKTLTNWGEEWGTFGDAQFDCQSFTLWSLIKYPKDSNNYAMKIEVNLPECKTVVYRYTGIYSYMSYPPHKSYDLSLFSGIFFEYCALELEGKIDVFVQLTDLKTPLRAWHIAPIYIDSNSQMDELNLKKIFIPFTSFTYPSWYTPEKVLPLDLKHIYKIAFLFMPSSNYRQKAHGKFILDNIKFFK